MLVYIKGYDVKTISKKMSEKAGFGESLSEVVAPEQLKKEIHEVLDNKGFVYALYKKKDMVACYLIERRAGEPVEQENVDASITKDKEHKNDILALSGEYVLPGHDSGVVKFDEAVIEELKERIYFYGDAARIEFKELELTEKSYQVGGFNIGGAMLGFAIGFLLFGVAMDNYALGICLGFAFASSYGVMFSVRNKSGNDGNGEEDKDENKEENEGDANTDTTSSL